MTTDHRNNHVLPEIWIAEFNGGVRIWIGSEQIAVSVHVQWKYGKESLDVLPKFASRHKN